QETYVRAMSGLARFAGRSCARTWLLSIARRVVIDRHRTAAVRPRTADTADWQGAAERAQPRHLPGFDESVAVFDALRHLDPARRQAFVLTQVTYVRAMSGLARFAGRSCARTWLLSIARRVVIDRHRTAAVR
ncbi:hypothetical protein EF908_12925, partial [Streptomyces sp. WAC04770]